MALKKFKKIDKKGHEEIWEWDETPELRAFIKKQSLLKLSVPYAALFNNPFALESCLFSLLNVATAIPLPSLAALLNLT